jgi:pyruvate,water dikinase
MTIALVVRAAGLPGRINDFRRTFNALMGPRRPDFSSTSLEVLALEYRRLEKGLAMSWDAPIANDFFAMVFFGTLRKLSTAWCDDAAGTLPNDLLLAEGGMISAEPAARVRALAGIAAQSPQLTTALCNAPPGEALAAARSSARFATELDGYLDQFGDRCESELKLESLTLLDDPTPLLRAAGRLAARPASDMSVSGRILSDGTSSPGLAPRTAASERVRRALRGAPLRRMTFDWVLANARQRIVDRENLRFDRTRLFGRIRAIFVAIGRRLASMATLDDERDIFYLELEEVLGYIEGGASTADLRGLVAVRKAEFTAALDGAAPPERFETRGAPSASALTVAASAASHIENARTASANPMQRRGLGCCPGIARGEVRVIRDPHAALLQTGEILVAERTDPGWVVLFPAARGILVERGSLLSHAAIVSRELGIPSVVGIAGLTSWLHDGDVVEFNGASGIVELLSRREGVDDA